MKFAAGTSQIGPCRIMFDFEGKNPSEKRPIMV